MHRHAVRAVLAALAAPCSAFAAAEPPSDEAAVVVVATRQSTRASALAADVTLIERQDIELAGPNATLGDLLARSAGVELSRSGSRGASEGIFLRGANTGHTLVLLDGLRINSATLGETGVQSIPLSQIERIEILRGAGSALYGSDAIGGVVRITTRQASDTPLLEASIGLGSRGSQEASLAHAGRAGKLGYSLRLEDSRASGVNAITNPSSAAYNPDKDGFWRRSAALRADWQAAPGTEIGGHWLESDGMNRFDTSFPSATSDWQTRHKLTTFGARARSRLSDAWTAEIRVGQGEDSSITTPSQSVGQARDVFRTRQNQFVWQNDLRLPVGRGMAALESLHENVGSTRAYPTTSRRTDSLVLGWNGAAGAHFWQAGARHDDSSQFGGKATGSLGYGYYLTEALRVSAAVGTAFKAPTFNDLYFPNTPFVGAGNPSLVPESARSREAAVRYEQGSTSASLTVFRNQISNLIQWEESPPGSWFYVPRNVGKARIIGWTAAGRTLVGGWALEASVTGQDPKDLDTGEYLVRRATHYGSFAASRAVGPWSGGIELQASGPRYDAPDFVTKRNTRKMGGYGLVNLRGEYRLSDGWSLFARLDNVFDKHYELVRSSTTNFASLGTTVFVGAHFSMR